MWRNGKKKTKYQSRGQILMIPTKEICPNPDQPRREFNLEKLLELAQSIGENGMIHPLTIRFQEDKPVLIAGERRLRAAKIAGIREVPCIEMAAESAQSALLALVENLQREDMNCFEEAEGIRRLIELHGLTQEDAATRLGCAQSTIANRLRLLRLPPEERRAILAAGLTERHARALIRLNDPELRAFARKQMEEERLNAAQSDRLVDDLLRGGEDTPPEKLQRQRPMPLVRDVRLFLNTVNHAVDTMRRSGIEASAEKTETEEFIEYRVRISRQAAYPLRSLSERQSPVSIRQKANCTA